MSASVGHADCGYLAACIPADARRLRVHDENLAHTLTLGGAQVLRDARERADVEIAPGTRLDGEAAWVVVSLDLGRDPGGRGRGSRVAKVGRRAFGYARLRTRAAVARLALRRRGYRTAFALGWDVGHWCRLPGAPRLPRRFSLEKRFPQHVAVVGIRREAPRTLLDATLTEARADTGLPLRPQWSLAQAGLLIVMTDSGVLRVAASPARRRVHSQVMALESLWATPPLPDVYDRLPRLLAHGRHGLGDWSLEQRLVGRRASLRMPNPLLEQCVGFLIALHRTGEAMGGEPRLAESDAAVVARACLPEQAAAVRMLAAEADAELRGIPLGFGHGDFWPGNLLVEEDRLVGVIDWCTAGPARLPALDLLSLSVSVSRRAGCTWWGPAIVKVLLPWVEDGGDGWLRPYCRGIGIELGPTSLHALIVSYWLGRLANRIYYYPERLRNFVWVRNNLDIVLRALVAERGRLPAP